MNFGASVDDGTLVSVPQLQLRYLCPLTFCRCDLELLAEVPGGSIIGVWVNETLDGETNMAIGKSRCLQIAYPAAIAAICALTACDGLSSDARVAVYPDLGTALHGPSVVWDYENGINPATNIRTSGPYDWEDLYRGPNGFLLPGDVQLR